MVFNLIYSSGLYFGVYNENTTKLAPEDYPPGTPIMYKNLKGQELRGYVQSFPSPINNAKCHTQKKHLLPI